MSSKSTTPTGVLRIRRGQSRAHEPLPAGLIPGGPYRTDEQRAALRRLAAVIATSGIDGPGEFRALRDLLRRRPAANHRTRRRRSAAGRIARHRPAQAPRRAARQLLPVHPGAARVWQDVDRRAARRPSDRSRGQRVGVAAIEPQGDPQPAARDRGRRRRRSTSISAAGRSAPATTPSRRSSSKLDRSFIENEPDMHAFPPPDDVRLVAGTAWLYSPGVHGRRARLSGHRRGRAGVARRRSGDGHLRTQPHPARRPAAARAGLPGRPSRRSGRLGARAPARRARHDPARAAASSSTARGGCTPTSAGSCPRSSTRAACTRSPSAPARRVDADGHASPEPGCASSRSTHAGNTRASTEEADAIADAIAGLTGATVTEV